MCIPRSDVYRMMLMKSVIAAVGSTRLSRTADAAAAAVSCTARNCWRVGR